MLSLLGIQMLLLCQRVALLLSGVWMAQVDVRGRLGEFALRLDEARLQVDDVLAQGVVLGLDGLVVVLEGVQLTHLLLKLLDVSFLALAECSLFDCLFT